MERSTEDLYGRKGNHGLGRAAAVLVTAALVVLAVLAFAYRDRLSGDGLRRMLRGAPAADDPAAYTYEIGSGQVFAAAGNGLAVASSSAVQLLDGGGETVFKLVVSYEQPMVSASAAGALFCDLGSTRCALADLRGAKDAPAPRGDILTAHLNDSGWIALTTAAAGAKALVTVYDDAGRERYEWWSGSGYVLRACVSPDNRLLAALCAEPGGGRLHLLPLDSETELAAVEFPEELPFDLCFLGSGDLCAVSDSAMTFLDSAGAVKNRLDFGSAYLIDYDFGSQSFAAVYLSPYRTGAGGLVETLSPTGEVLGAAEAARDVTGLSAAGRRLLVRTAGDLTVYSGQDLTVLYRREGLVTAREALLCQDGSILLLSSYAAEKLPLNS